MSVTKTFERYDPTKRCIVWKYDNSRLYIHKWRIPACIPEKITVSIYLAKEAFEKGLAEKLRFYDEINRDERYKNEPISRYIYYEKECENNTVRYCTRKQVGEYDVPFPHVYIPKYLLSDYVNPKVLLILIGWKAEK